MDLWVSDLAPGDRVHVAMTKWGGARHWTFDAKWLGSDEHGHWLGQHRRRRTLAVRAPTL